jgi:membrane-bound ClpP family serine protease
MTLTIIILFILIGIFLIWLEFFIVPGITVAGIGGTVLLLGGITYAYAELDRMSAHVILLSTFLLLGLVLVISFRSNTWNKTALTTKVEGQIEGIDEAKIKIGDIGKTISRLAPMGKVMVNGEIVEAKSKLGYIDEKEEIVVLDIYSTNILVEKA